MIVGESQQESGGGLLASPRGLCRGFFSLLYMVVLSSFAGIGCSSIFLLENVSVSLHLLDTPLQGPPVTLMYDSYVESYTFGEAIHEDGHARRKIIDISFGFTGGSGIPLSDGSILTADHVREVMFGGYYFEGRKFRPDSFDTPEDDIEFKRYTVRSDGESIEDGLFRIFMPETERFARSFEFDIRENPRPLTNEEFDAKYPPGTPVTISGYIKNPVFGSQGKAGLPDVEDAWVLQQIVTTIMPRDIFAEAGPDIPDIEPDFLYMPVPRDIEMSGMSGGPVTTIDSEGNVRLIGVIFFSSSTSVSLLGLDLPWKAPRVAQAFIWPYESKLTF